MRGNSKKPHGEQGNQQICLQLLKIIKIDLFDVHRKKYEIWSSAFYVDGLRIGVNKNVWKLFGNNTFFHAFDNNNYEKERQWCPFRGPPTQNSKKSTNS